jgi:hypothetical protein
MLVRSMDPTPPGRIKGRGAASNPEGRFETTRRHAEDDGWESALLCGEGLMLASDVSLKGDAEHGGVQRVLAGWTGPQLDFNAVFPRGQVQSPKVRAFIDFLVERLSFDADYMKTLCPNRRHADAIAARATAQAMAQQADAGIVLADELETDAA